ncbi:zinc ribbon domain-containing protein [Streptomyces guryensis]|uniref:Zinc ribbon domain-containing protein n=1 Tax=Streptomyces guryensis TaxID=2886947 RepID=A0A9Q3ZB09_9ACTN|nr:zinc ribbon domain-containing protein [Streptomyces guryensis]MCD9878127.1 zinc ribbon domain-containing protein [Streptomyces guryensis]
MKVTRIAYSHHLNAGKYGQLDEQARRLGQVRSLVWRRYGSLAGVGVSDRTIRDQWMADGTADTFGVLANAWKETVRDAVGDIKAAREAAKVPVRRAISRSITDKTEQKRLFTALKRDQWADDPYLSRMMRRQWRRGRNRTVNQIVVRCDQYRTYRLGENGNMWLAVPSMVRRKMIAIPLNTTIAPAGTLRLILRNGLVEVHYAIDASVLKSSQRPCGTGRVGVDKGYTEVLTDSDGHHHGEELGELLRAESDFLKVKDARRAKIRAVAEKAGKSGNQAKADRMIRNNLGTSKRSRRRRVFEAKVRTVTFTAVHAVVDKAKQVVAEDLTRPFTSRKKLGKNTNRRLAMWPKGVTAEALANVSERRGSALTLVNAAYTSQVVPCCRTLGKRQGDRLDCTQCGAVWQADHAGAINVLERDGDPGISLFTPHTRVKQLIQERDDRHRTRLPVQDSSPTRRRAKHPIRATTLNE